MMLATAIHRHFKPRRRLGFDRLDCVLFVNQMTAKHTGSRAAYGKRRFFRRLGSGMLELRRLGLIDPREMRGAIGNGAR